MPIANSVVLVSGQAPRAASASVALSTEDAAKVPALVSGRVPTDGSGVTQPISGSVTANIGTSGSLALESGGNLAASKTDLDTLVARTPVLGQALAAAAVPVVLPLSQMPNVATAAPSTTASGIPVRSVPDWAPGKQIHAQTSVGVTNGANKLLFGFTNTTGATVYVARAHLSNTQTTSITGVMCQINVQVGTSAITGGTTVTTISSPALIASCRDISNPIPAGITFNTNGALGGTISTLESVRWSTDEVQANGSGSLSELIFAIGSALDTFNFTEDPIPVANNQSFGIVCDASATNGATLVDFNILRP